MRGWWKRLAVAWRAIVAIGVVLGLVASGLAIALVFVEPKDIRDGTSAVGDWLYPLPLIVLLTVAVVVLLVLLLRARRPLPPAPATAEADQARLDELFTKVPRGAIRALRDANFDASWDRDLDWPLMGLLLDLYGVEYEFDDQELEPLRLSLRETTNVFLNEQALKGFNHPVADGFRHTGITETEMMADPSNDLYRLHSERRDALHAAADAVADAHDALVSAAKAKGYRLDTLRADPPTRRPLSAIAHEADR